MTDNDNEEFAGGSGTEEDPYLIETAEHLDNVREYMDAHYLQIDDIDLDGWGDFMPIGMEGYLDRDDIFYSPPPFIGVYDGGEYQISNMNIDLSFEESGVIPGAGMFVRVEGGTLKNIELINSNIDYNQHSGLLAGEVVSIEKNILIENCHVEGNIIIKEDGNANFVGGLIASMFPSEKEELIVSECSSDIDINIKEGAEPFTGGFVGDMVNFDYYTHLVENCYSRGKIHGPGPEDDDFHKAGFVGNVEPYDDDGIMEIKNCYSTVELEEPGILNGFLGEYYDSSDGEMKVTNCYWDKEASGVDSSTEGEGRTTEEMTDPYDENTTYIDWDFEEVWYIEHFFNDGYPVLVPPEISILTSKTIMEKITSRIFARTNVYKDLNIIQERTNVFDDFNKIKGITQTQIDRSSIYNRNDVLNILNKIYNINSSFSSTEKVINKSDVSVITILYSSSSISNIIEKVLSTVDIKENREVITPISYITDLREIIKPVSYVNYKTSYIYSTSKILLSVWMPAEVYQKREFEGWEISQVFLKRQGEWVNTNVFLREPEEE